MFDADDIIEWTKGFEVSLMDDSSFFERIENLCTFFFYTARSRNCLQESDSRRSEVRNHRNRELHKCKRRIGGSLDDIALEDRVTFLEKRIKKENIIDPLEIDRCIGEKKVWIKTPNIDMMLAEFRYDEVIDIVCAGSSFLVAVDVGDFHA